MKRMLLMGALPRLIAAVLMIGVIWVLFSWAIAPVQGV